MVKIRRQLVRGTKRGYSGTSTRTSITIHETANRNRGADAAAHANLQSGGNSRAASWHWQVDDKEAVQSWPHTVRCWHAGRLGRNSIAIEICVNSDGDYGKALANTAELVAYIRREEPSVKRIVQHWTWTWKNCPTLLRAGKGGGWKSFLAMCSRARSGGAAARDDDRKPLTAKQRQAAKVEGLQRAVHVGVDRKWGPVTDRRLVLVREASRFGGNDFPDGVAASQRAVGTEPDGKWGPKSRAAHDQTVIEIQRALGVTADGKWGPKTDAAWKSARADLKGKY